MTLGIDRRIRRLAWWWRWGIMTNEQWIAYSPNLTPAVCVSLSSIAYTHPGYRGCYPLFSTRPNYVYPQLYWSMYTPGEKWPKYFLTPSHFTFTLVFFLFLFYERSYFAVIKQILCECYLIYWKGVIIIFIIYYCILKLCLQFFRISVFLLWGKIESSNLFWRMLNFFLLPQIN